MRILLVLTCSFALASFAGAAQEQSSPPPKKKGHDSQTNSVQSTQKIVTPKGHPTRTEEGAKKGVNAVNVKLAKTRTSGHAVEKGKLHTEQNLPTEAAGSGSMSSHRTTVKSSKSNSSDRTVNTSKSNTFRKGSAATTFKAKHFNLANKPNPAIQNVKFQAGNRIQDSQNWQGSQYVVFRNYTPQWHDQIWWRSHHTRIVFVFGGWYFWNANYWYPAWGYDQNAYYAYDGPIYAYNGLDPGQVVANVQAALQAQGYYAGGVDGLLGPLTRAAITNYQRDHGLYPTAAIDQPTLARLGLS